MAIILIMIIIVIIIIMTITSTIIIRDLPELGSSQLLAAETQILANSVSGWNQVLVHP